MSKRHDLDLRRHNLGEIREILEAMKSFAYMETRKIARVLNHQQALVKNMEAVASDFKKFFLIDRPSSVDRSSITIAIGTERGFCGDINHSIQVFTDSFQSPTDPSATDHLIVVGRKLHNLFANNPRAVAFIEGASVLDDVDNVVLTLVEKLTSIQSRCDWMSLRVIYHYDESRIVTKSLLPPFQSAVDPDLPEGLPPVLMLSPGEFFLQLTEQFLLAALHEILSTSLMSENHRRMTHLEQAVHHLTEEESDLLQHSNRLRQEEITEELEVILLSADSLEQSSRDLKS